MTDIPRIPAQPPQSYTRITGAPCEPSRRTSFNTDGGQPSPLLANALDLAATVSRGLIRDATPRMDAVLFLHNVTGISEIELAQDAFGRLIGLRARSRLTRRNGLPIRAFIDLKFEGT